MAAAYHGSNPPLLLCEYREALASKLHKLYKCMQKKCSSFPVAAFEELPLWNTLNADVVYALFLLAVQSDHLLRIC